MPRTYSRLSQLEVNNAKVGMHADGGGLYLQVTKPAFGRLNKSWLYRYSVGGRERQMGLGSLADVKLADARQKAAECRQRRLEGIDPIEARESARRMAEESAITFRRAFETFFATKRKSLSNAKHAAQWRSTMETYVFPSIGGRPVADIEAREILDLLTPLWFAKAETATRLLQRMEAVFKSAILRGYRQRVSPCVGVKEELGTRPHKVINHRALHYRRVPAFLTDLRVTNSQPATKLAFEWLVLTATRSGETRLARWSEIDKRARLWTIPAERMKAKRSHVVPLSKRCLEILKQARASYPPVDLIFPGVKTGARAFRHDIHESAARHGTWQRGYAPRDEECLQGLVRRGRQGARRGERGGPCSHSPREGPCSLSPHRLLRGAEGPHGCVGNALCEKGA